MATAGLGEVGAEEDAVDRARAGGGAGDDGVGNAGEDRVAPDDKLSIRDPNRRSDRHLSFLPSLFFVSSLLYEKRFQPGTLQRIQRLKP